MNAPLASQAIGLPVVTTRPDRRRIEETEQPAVPVTYNEELSCKGHPCPNCGHCRDWYFTGNAAELDWLRDEQHWDYEGDAWNRWCSDQFDLKFKPRDGKTCVGRLNFIFPFTVGQYVYGFHPRYGNFPHGPVGQAVAIPFAETLPYDYYGYYSDFCVCKDNVHK